MAECFIILGPPRSGTSLVAGLLHRLGVVMGWELQSEDGKPRYDWPDAWEMNPKGFYQDAPIENICDEIWSQDFPDEKGELPTEAVAKLQGLIQMRCSRGHAKWGFKTSRTQWLLPEIMAACTDDVRFIVTSRDEELSKRSLVAWLGEGDGGKINNWAKRANKALGKVVRNYPSVPRIEIAFDELFDNTDNMLRALSGFVGLPLTQEVREFVDPSLRRVF